GSVDALLLEAQEHKIRELRTELAAARRKTVQVSMTAISALGEARRRIVAMDARLSQLGAAHPGLTCAEAQELLDHYRAEEIRRRAS
ncbi:MAG: hypothetical protein D6683_15810, partial [Actinomyces sp.]